MNFFSNWGKTKTVNDNKKPKNESFETTVVNGISTSTLNEGSDSNSRTYYKTKNRRKNILFTRSLWYDNDRTEREIDNKMTRAQSFDNLDCVLEEGYLSRSAEQKMKSNANPGHLKQDSVPFNFVKKSFSLENLTRIGMKGKTRTIFSKDMISNPIDCRIITENDDQFGIFPSFENISEEKNDIVELTRSIELIETKNNKVAQNRNTDFIHTRAGIRRTQSMTSLMSNQTNTKISLRKSLTNIFPQSTCSNEHPQKHSEINESIASSLDTPNTGFHSREILSLNMDSRMVNSEKLTESKNSNKSAESLMEDVTQFHTIDVLEYCIDKNTTKNNNITLSETSVKNTSGLAFNSNITDKISNVSTDTIDGGTLAKPATGVRKKNSVAEVSDSFINTNSSEMVSILFRLYRSKVTLTLHYESDDTIDKEKFV